MAQIGTVKIQTSSGKVKVPVYATGDSGSSVYENLRVQTSSGTGFIPLTSPADASYNYLRIQTSNHGTIAVHDNVALKPSSATYQWKFDQGSGSTAYDSISNNDAAISGASWKSASNLKGGYGLSFDGSSSYVEPGTVTEIQPGNSFSMCITVDADNTNDCCIWTQVVDSNNHRAYIGVDNGNLNAGTYDYQESGNTYRVDDSGMSTTLMRVALVWDASNDDAELFVDGNKVGDTTSTNGRDTGLGGEHVIGATGDFDRNFDGTLDNPIIYNTNLSSTQIKDDYKRQPWS